MSMDEGNIDVIASPARAARAAEIAKRVTEPKPVPTVRDPGLPAA